MKKRLKITGEKVVDRKSLRVLGTNPTEFPDLVDNCKVAWATMTTGVKHELKKSS